jgi:DNA-nicking Smr family endonuclease
MTPARRTERAFVREDPGDGRADDLAAKILAELRRGRPAPERDVDLHGLDAREAAREVRDALARAREEGVRCARIIHGRGLHSESGAVLRDLVPGWLTKPPLAAIVLAFARSRRDGGGSTHVLLRRKRP